MSRWCAAGLMVVSVTLGQTSPFRWELAGQTGGPTQAVAVSGSFAYAGVGLNVRVVDLSDPRAPSQVGVSPSFTHSVEAIAIRGATAVVAAGPAGIAILDISDPRHPAVLGAMDTRGFASGIAAVGNLAFVADGPRGLAVVDISRPASPALLGSTGSLQYINDVVVRGEFAYLAAGTAGLLVADISDPAHPSIVSAYDTPGFAYSLAAVGDTVYVADGWEGIRIFRVAGGTHVESGHFKTAGWAFGVTVTGSRAYVADAFRGLAIVDVSDPAAPAEVTRWEQTGAQTARVVLADGHAILADRNLGLLVVDLAPARPALLGSHRPIGVAVGLAVDGSYAYLANGNAGLAIVDVSNPDAPVEISAIDSRGYFAEHVAVAGGFAYLTVKNTDRGDEIQIFDVADPYRPRRVSAYSAIDHVRARGQAYRDIAISNRIAHVPTEWGLELIDISDPSRPVTAGYTDLDVSLTGASLTFAIAVHEGTAFVVAGAQGVIVVDVSDPAHLAVLPNYDTGSYADDVAAAGGRLYQTDHAGLHVVDATDPGRLTTLGFLPTPVPSTSVAVAEPTVFLSNDANVLVVDATVPSQPVLRQAIPISGLAQEVVAHRGLLYVAAGTGGLTIFRPSAGTPPAAEPAPTGDPLLWSRLRTPRTPRSVLSRIPAPRETASGQPREAAGDCIVSTTADRGPGSLRACLQTALDASTITFSPAVFPPAQPATIHLMTALGAIQRVSGITIDASDAGVILDGSALTMGPGIWLQSSGNTVRGLQILGFPTGISVGGADNVIGGDRSVGRGPTGQGNVVSGTQGGFAIVVSGNGNRVEGNLVGTDAAGRTAVPNRSIGIFVGASSGNIITDNVASGNLGNGINLGGSASGNIVRGNFAGTDITGTHAIPNGSSGIVVETNALDNLVEGNIASGNVIGIALSDPGTSFNAILNNRIGTDVTGTEAIPNTLCAAINGLGATFNRFEGNLVSGNHQGLCLLGGQGSTGVQVIGNRIGTDVTGRLALPNQREGAILGGTPRMMVQSNVLSGNGAAGLRLSGDGIFVADNFIGTDARGSPLGNGGEGVVIDGTRDNFLQSNRIANNAEPGVGIRAPGVRNTLRRNSIYDNRLAIDLAAGANEDVPPPILAQPGRTSVSGTACAGCEVEIYSDANGQGYLLEGVTVSFDGTFVLEKPGGFAGPGLTATATDRSGNTSGFSAPVLVGRPAAPLSIVSAATFKSGPVAAGAIVTAYGSGLATATAAAPSLPLPEVLAGTRIEVHDRKGAVIRAPLIFVSPGQANLVIPQNAAVGPAALLVTSGDGSVSGTIVEIVPVAPGLFSASANGEGLAAAVVQRNTAEGTSYELVARFNSQGQPVAVPIDLGTNSDLVFLLLYGTGIRNHGPLSETQVSLGGEQGTVTAAGPVEAFPGLDQVNVLLPQSLRGRGRIAVELVVDGQSANTVQVEVQ